MKMLTHDNIVLVGNTYATLQAITEILNSPQFLMYAASRRPGVAEEYFYIYGALHKWQSLRYDCGKREVRRENGEENFSSACQRRWIFPRPGCLSQGP